jgi:hypothetical protein
MRANPVHERPESIPLGDERRGATIREILQRYRYMSNTAFTAPSNSVRISSKSRCSDEVASERTNLGLEPRKVRPSRPLTAICLPSKTAFRVFDALVENSPERAGLLA